MASRFQQLLNFETDPPEILSDCPWRDDFVGRLQRMIQKYGVIWSEIVNAISRDQNSNEKLQNIVYETLESAFQGLIIDATTMYEKNLEIVTKYSEKVDNLEMILEVDTSNKELVDQELSLVELKENQLERIKMLEKEIERKEKELKQERRSHGDSQSLEEIIESYKTDLEILWDKCQCGGEIRNEFQFMYTTNYNYETVRIFEKEISRWKSYFEGYREILNTVNAYEKLLKEIDELQLNSNQLEAYKNRNCLLFRELRKKNLMTSRLKSIEEKLRKQSDFYFRKNKEQFLTFGTDIDGLINKGLKRRKFLAVTIAVPAQQKTPQMKKPKNGSSGTTPVAAKKRNTPVSETRRKKGATPQRANSQIPTFKLNESKRTSPKKKLQWKPSRLSLKLSKADSEDDSYLTEYSDFEKEVTEKNTRSSATGTEK